MSAGIGDGLSAASYDRFSAGVNWNISLTSDVNVRIGDKSGIVKSKEKQKVEALKTLDQDLSISTDGVSNPINTPLSVNDKALTVIINQHSDTAL
jgi:hypothetical protein